ncbi:homoserine dehydrogenase [Cytobacillus depressus]|uniref:homoserine dehydrogenase n=1 Tax=Cytobacillus depressus TaxID=1602942 RepID=UPI001FEC053F|nr:homoserine dehydrogenase [Cytobacillus depressus]
MFAHHGGKLKQLASENGVSLGFEATVAGGIPVIQTLKQLLNVNNVDKFQGILNGTSNFILTKMREENLPFASALKLAQEKGYAEADPTNDVDGYDAFYKAVILSELAFWEAPNWDEPIREGIRGITPEQVEIFSSLGFRFKHVALIERNICGIQCTVKPVLVNEQHLFYHVEGVQNAVSINGDIVGNISLQGPGAGMLLTATAIIEDLANINKNNLARGYSEQKPEENDAPTLSFWAISGDVNVSILPSPIEVIERIDPNVLIVRAPEETIFAILLPNVHVYQILGDVAFRGVVLI